MSEPFLSFEIKEHDDRDNNHDPPQNEVGMRVIEFRHIFKVHPVNASDEGEGDEDGGEDGQYFHDIIDAVAGISLVEVYLI